ncbi:hypothetical protein OsI_08515 [Oryza sativa Indica Group]|uniref:PB1 domain-containing protein n=1 Tax=Oryza sativa subsp. indica TaxID=39946 RepID=A2X8F3_ORYSI|nr:hypothetical protein OsI_08515 [Oryza sativa Indica Group]
MDPSSTYLLDVRIMGKTCRPEFPGGFSFKWPIDADVTNFKDFLGDICEKYPWALNETVCLHYIHASSKELIPICKDQDLTAMFECFHHTKRGKVVITLGNQINLSQVIVPCTPSLSVPSQAFFTQEGSTSQASKSDAYLENPFPHYEHVGVDDEKQYSVGIDDSSSESDDSSSESDDSIAETDNVPEVEGGDDLSITDSDDEEWIARDAQADPVIPQVAYDKENPPMTVETIYPSILRSMRCTMVVLLLEKARRLWMRSEFSTHSKELLEKSRGLNFDLDRSDDFIAEVTDKDPGRPKTLRHKGGVEGNKKGKRKAGTKCQQKCPIYKNYGHRWTSCKEADPEAKEAYALVAKQRKLKRKSKPKSTSAATVATENIDPTAMSSQILASLSSAVGGTISDSGLESNNEPLPSLPSSMTIVPLQHVAVPVAKGKGKEKGKGKGKKEDKDKKIKRKPSPTVQPTTPPAKRRKNNEGPQDSPAMRTRSKKSSPAMGTRSKRRIID